MKKTILIILAALPIVLLVVIALAGRIVVLLQYTPVDSVEFIDRLGNVYPAEEFFEVGQGESKPTIVRVSPPLANNKNVTYTSEDESICTIDENGIITGVHWGTTTVTATTEEGNISVKLNVLVTADEPFAVTLSKEEINLKVGAQETLVCEVDAPVAIDRRVTYTSSNTSVVTVDRNGNLKARGAGTAIITVTTVLGEKTDTCVVNVEEGVLPVALDLESNPNIRKTVSQTGTVVYSCSTNTLDLRAMLKTDKDVDPETVKFKIISGATAGSSDNLQIRAEIDENGVLKLYMQGLVNVLVYVGDEGSPTHQIEYSFGLQMN